MGAGKSRTINKIVVELEGEDGNPSVFVDMDLDLVEKMQKDYEDGITDFDMTDEDFYKSIQDKGVKAVYGWGLDDVGDVNILNDESPVRNGDLKYYIHTAIETASAIQNSFQESTGSKDKVVDYITFDTPSGDINLTGGTRGYQEKTLVTSVEKVSASMSTHRQYNSSVITLDASSGARLSKEQMTHFKNNGKFDVSKTDTLIPILTERSSSRNGWFSASGSYAKSTVSHEMGHAVLVSMQEVFGKRFSKAMFSEWHKRTYNSPVSGYAQRNYSESFAECFSLYVVGGKSSSKMYSEFKDIMNDFGLSNMYGCVK